MTSSFVKVFFDAEQPKWWFDNFVMTSSFIALKFLRKFLLYLSSSNFRAYRELLSRTNPPCLPYFGIPRERKERRAREEQGKSAREEQGKRRVTGREQESKEEESSQKVLGKFGKSENSFLFPFTFPLFWKKFPFLAFLAAYSNFFVIFWENFFLVGRFSIYFPFSLLKWFFLRKKISFFRRFSSRCYDCERW